METDFFAGIPVNDLAKAQAWYESLFGGPPAFFPNDTEAVWEIGLHQYAYVVLDPEHAGHALVTIISSDIATVLDRISGHGITASLDETYENGMRKVTFTDADGNQVAFGGTTS
jgi:catechol 2,3-dioxygenase-like lactoylglutathione lyase family enzyme